MIADDGNPILMDFGSAVKARMKIETRQQALLQQVLSAFLMPPRYQVPLLSWNEVREDGNAN